MSKRQKNTTCKQCGNIIPAEAKLCAHCHSYQDWRIWFPISSTILALLTALISVIGATFPTIYRLIHTPQSNAYFMAPSINGNTLQVIAVNTGDAPASLLHTQIRSKYLASATKIRLRNESDAIIPFGSKLLTFDIIPLLNEQESYQMSLDVLKSFINQEASQTSIVFESSQFNGTHKNIEFSLSLDDLFSLLRANADRCAAIKEASFENGCIGTGKPSFKG